MVIVVIKVILATLIDLILMAFMVVRFFNEINEIYINFDIDDIFENL
jgi:hypothetical protein